MNSLELARPPSALTPELAFAEIKASLTSDAARRVRERLAALPAQPGPLLLDLRGLELDAEGLGAVLSAQYRLECQERSLLVVTDDPNCRRLLHAVGAGHALTLFTDLEHAREAGLS